jgi:hypothetical protein
MENGALESYPLPPWNPDATLASVMVFGKATNNAGFSSQLRPELSIMLETRLVSLS